MDEFIVWDMAINKPVVAVSIEDYIDINFKDRYKAFKDIGLKDINAKSIYADCSIVEFTYWFREDLENKRVDEKQMKGYFYYDNNTLSYLFHNLVDNRNYFYGRFNFKENIKIIDTIQENKLGLIK